MGEDTLRTWPEITPSGPDLLEEVLLNLLETPWDLAGLDIPDDPSIFDSLLWPDDGEDQYGQEYTLDVDLSGTDGGCPSTSQAGEQDFAFVEHQLPVESLRGSVPPEPGVDHTQTQPSNDQREFNDCLHVFESGLKDVSHRRKRRRFSPDRRKEVDQLRKCKLDRPCSACIKACGSPKLGKALCIRQSLLHVRFILDLWHRNSEIEWLQNEVTPLAGPKDTIKVFFYNYFADQTGSGIPAEKDPARKYRSMTSPRRVALGLEILVQSFNPTEGREKNHDLYIRSLDTYQARPTPAPFYAIPEDALPTLQDLETWALDTLTSYHMVPFLGGLRSSFISLARKYYESQKELPLKDLMQKAVRLSALHGIRCRVLTLERESRDQPKKFASQAVHTQLAVIITKGIVDLEIDLFSELQRRIFGAKGLGKDNMLPIWMSLWLLILTYRETVEVWWSREHKHEGLPQLAQHMYDMLVSMYSALFRPSSPLWLIGLRPTRSFRQRHTIYELFRLSED